MLIVDDNADAAEMMAMLLSSYGHQVQTAGDAESTLRIANEFVPDVILLDIGLLGTDGHTVARILRRDPRFLGTILIALTGYGSARDRERSLESGFDHHVVKPAQIDQLLALIGTPDE
ncbi:response regulator [Streptomyces sp. A1136]|nr:response regulator [Streptomyces sp. A1136]